METDPNYGLAYFIGTPGWHTSRRESMVTRCERLKRAKELLPENAVIDSDIGRLYAVSGHHREARAILAELDRKRFRSYVSSFELALIHAGLGEKDKALSEMERAFQERSDMLVYLGVDPRLDGLRSEPRFGELLRRIAIP